MRTYRAPAIDIIQGDFSSRITTVGEGSECSFMQANRVRHRWKEQGSFSIFSFGGFDVLGLNHIRGLVQCRAIGAMCLLGIDEVRTPEEQRVVHEVAASGMVRLMVSIDTNRTLEEGKSRSPEKGGAPKPTLDWPTRATMVAVQSIPTADYTGRRDLVDFVTRQGWESCDSCGPGDCPNEWHTDIISGTEPDLVIVRDDLPRTIAHIADKKEQGLLAETQVALISEQDGAYIDAVLGGTISTTSIIERIRS